MNYPGLLQIGTLKYLRMNQGQRQLIIFLIPLQYGTGGYKKMNQITAFFDEYKKEIDFFKNCNISITDNMVYDDFSEYDDFINELIGIYENICDTVAELNSAVDFICRMQRIGTDDNLMGLNLRMAYFYCVGAIIEYLDFLRGWNE